ncbi:hypothetical protein [Nesterenkonia xinjiangensis]|uniref:Uncharacterized protein n=1 Tax=Nesterenkonia xinjiangensis TaxID=225327 RepID=A0A7Z0KC71_9MICC|nr:hypothetical protein [Nesterenkonia xinjiangensis]NYJ78352.1 hypothetical protein [Nesterenkonia xinjiangensis]
MTFDPGPEPRHSGTDSPLDRRSPNVALEDRFDRPASEGSELPRALSDALEPGDGGEATPGAGVETAADSAHDASGSPAAEEPVAMERSSGVPNGAWYTAGLFLLGALGWILYFFGWRPGRNS